MILILICICVYLFIFLFRHSLNLFYSSNTFWQQKLQRITPAKIRPKKFKIEGASDSILTCLWIVQHSSQKHKALFIRKNKLFYYTFGATSHRQPFFNTNWNQEAILFLFSVVSPIPSQFLICGPFVLLWVYLNPVTYVHKRCSAASRPHRYQQWRHCSLLLVAIILQITYFKRVCIRETNSPHDYYMTHDFKSSIFLAKLSMWFKIGKWLFKQLILILLFVSQFWTIQFLFSAHRNNTSTHIYVFLYTT